MGLETISRRERYALETEYKNLSSSKLSISVAILFEIFDVSVKRMHLIGLMVKQSILFRSSRLGLPCNDFRYNRAHNNSTLLTYYFEKKKKKDLKVRVAFGNCLHIIHARIGQ